MNNKGSTLIETLVAVALLSIISVSMFSLFSTGWAAAKLAGGVEGATLLAQQRLEQIKASASTDAPLTQGREPIDPLNFPGYSWDVIAEEQAPGLHQVTVSVYWNLLGRERRVSLGTYVRTRVEQP